MADPKHSATRSPAATGTPAASPEHNANGAKGGPRFSSYIVDGKPYKTEPEAVVKVYEALKAGETPFIVGIQRRGGSKLVLALKLVPDVDDES